MTQSSPLQIEQNTTNPFSLATSLLPKRSTNSMTTIALVALVYGYAWVRCPWLSSSSRPRLHPQIWNDRSRTIVRVRVRVRALGYLRCIASRHAQYLNISTIKRIGMPHSQTPAIVGQAARFASASCVG